MENITFDYNDGTLVISGTGKLDDNIPYEYCGSSVVIIEDGIEEIENMVFRHCHKLKTVKLPTTLKRIGDYAFAYSGLEEITVCNGLVYVGKGAFTKTEIKEMIFPDTVMEIGTGCFESCEKLQRIKFPAKLEVIPSHICRYCRSLSEVVLPENLRIIETEAFAECRNVTLDCRAGVLIQPAVFGEPSIWRCEMPPERIKRVHFTINEDDNTLYFKTYSEKEEELFAAEASKWRYDMSSLGTHETWYEDDEKSSYFLEKLKPKEYIIQDGKLVGVCLIGGTVSSSVWRTDRNLTLQQLYFDKRNGKEKITYDESAGNDDWHSGKHEVWKLSYKKE